MHAFKAAAGLAAVALLAAAGLGQENDKPPLASTIAPYVDGQTLLVFHADLAAFEATGAIDVLAEFLHMADNQRDRLQARVVPLSVLAGSLPPGGTADIFIVSSVSDLLSVPVFFVMPLGPGSPAGAISMELRRHVAADLNVEITSEQIAGALVTGSPRTLTRLKKAEATERPEIAAAFAAVDDTAVQMLFVPSADARRAFEVLFPNLPPQLGGGPTRELTGKVEWVVMGLNFASRKTDVHLVVQTVSPAAATSLAEGLSAVLGSLAEQPAVREKIPRFDELARRLTPQTAEAQLTLRIRASNEDVAALGSLLLPVLQSVEGMIAKRIPARQASDE